MNIKFSNLNIKEKIKEYSIYFFTIVITTCLFFSFLSIGDSNNIVMNNSEYDFSYYLNVVNILVYVTSISILFIVSYVNNYIYKEKMKSISILNILGADKKTLAINFSKEVFQISFIGVLIGLILGTIFSQILSLFMQYAIFSEIKSNFSIYWLTYIKTIIYFLILFLFMTLINIFKIGNKRPIYLIKDGIDAKIKPNSKIKQIINVILFLMSSLYIIYNIYVYFNIGRDFKGIIPHYESNKVQLKLFIVILIFIFTFITTIIAFIERKRNLNNKLFVFTSIEANLYKNIKLMAGLVILMTISILSFSMSKILSISAEENYINRMKNDMYINFDSFVIEDKKDIPDIDYYNIVSEVLKEKNNEIEDYVNLKFYYIDDSDFKPYSEKINRYDQNRLAIGQTDYNKLREMQGYNKIELNNDKFLYQVSNTIDTSDIEENLEALSKIKVNNKILYNVGETPQNYINKDNLGSYIYDGVNQDLLVFPDEIIENLSLAKVDFVANFKNNLTYKDAKDIDEKVLTILNNKLESLNNKYKKHLETEKLNSFISLIRIDDIEKVDIKFGSLITILLGSYIGLIFIILVMSILTIQSLVNIKNNLKNYKTLYILGMDFQDIENINKKVINSFISIPLILSITSLTFIIVSFYIRYKIKIDLFMGSVPYFIFVVFPIIIIIALVFIYIKLILKNSYNILKTNLH
ncbi:FtsX-like permease family protein [[Clostridium] colinum]|uniref:FtsX-like permease family protein n=1 Tax=[Clostridium] colinum TaxID=36835 RepID=UPI002024E887|nr:ABC transporter permease [[Clostridium] colinum]